MLSLVFRGVLSENCMSPAFLEVRDSETVYIPIYVESVVVNGAVEPPLEEEASLASSDE